MNDKTQKSSLQEFLNGNNKQMHALFVFAHPDDETIGAGGLLQSIACHASLVCLTDGAPRNMFDAQAAGHSLRDEYAHVRRKELECSLALAGIGLGQCRMLNFTDQDTSARLTEISRELAGLFETASPNLIFTHPYEGGHPDHDSAAFAVHTACKIMGGSGKEIAIYEFASYNAGINGEKDWNIDCLPDPSRPQILRTLTKSEQELKHRMMECYGSQRWIQNVFPVFTERFRSAPPYDFTQPPHNGKLFYERFGWEMNGANWRFLAYSASKDLGVS
jgi:N-acetylglucosamine malate deacetylase 2